LPLGVCFQSLGRLFLQRRYAGNAAVFVARDASNITYRRWRLSIRLASFEPARDEGGERRRAIAPLSPMGA
jgi:hypothetical protein